MCQPWSHSTWCQCLMAGQDPAGTPCCILGIPTMPGGAWLQESQQQLGEEVGNILHIIHLRQWPLPGCGAKGRMEVHFSDRVFTGFGFAASVRAEQHNSRLQRDTGPCNSISFDQFFSQVGNTPESVSACFMEGCKCLPWLIHKTQMGSWKTDILLSP